ncbi:MAG: glycine cleavage system protein H [Ignavibacteria bacterium]
MVALFVLLTFVVIISINLIVTKVREKRISVFEETQSQPAARTVFTKESIYVPQGFYYSKGHTWLNFTEDGKLKLGIDDFINKVLKPGKILMLKSEGDKVSKGEPIFEILANGRKVKIYSPVEGVISSLNQSILENVKLLRENPYRDNWLIEIEPADIKVVLPSFKIGREVVNWMKDEVNRFKDLLAHLSPKPSLVGATLYDGGNIVEGVVRMLDDNGLSKFEEEFLKLS